MEHFRITDEAVDAILNSPITVCGACGAFLGPQDSHDDCLGSIETRLTRIEAKLDRLVAALEGWEESA